MNQSSKLEAAKQLELELALKKKQEEFKKLKDAIREYIIDDPPTTASLKELVSIFKKILKQMHPKYQDKWTSLLSRPFPSQPTIPYFSYRTGTILNQGRHRIPVKSYSLLDLRAFARDKPVIKRDENYEEEENQEIQKDEQVTFWNEGLNLDEILNIPRSNSEHALYCIGLEAQLRREIQFPVDEKEKTRILSTIHNNNDDMEDVFNFDSDDEESQISLQDDVKILLLF